MEVGIKLWSTNPAKYVEDSDFADFIEVLPRSRKSLEKFARRPHNYTVHVPHEVFGFSPVLNMKKSQKLLQHAVNAAKKLGAELIVMHTGYLKKAPDQKTISNTIKSAARLAKTASYGRILLENSVLEGTFGIDKGKYYACYNHEQMKEVLELSGAGFCLDFEHAAIAAHQLGLDYKGYVATLMKLKPEYFHLSSIKLSKLYSKIWSEGHHVSIFEGDIDLNFVKETLKKANRQANKPVCLETPIEVSQRKKEVEFLKS